MPETREALNIKRNTKESHPTTEVCAQMRFVYTCDAEAMQTERTDSCYESITARHIQTYMKVVCYVTHTRLLRTVCTIHVRSLFWYKIRSANEAQLQMPMVVSLFGCYRLSVWIDNTLKPYSFVDVLVSMRNSLALRRARIPFHSIATVCVYMYLTLSVAIESKQLSEYKVMAVFTLSNIRTHSNRIRWVCMRELQLFVTISSKSSQFLRDYTLSQTKRMYTYIHIYTRDHAGII